VASRDPEKIEKKTRNNRILLLSMSTCNVCIEKINQTTRKLVKCNCDYVCCKSCAKQFLLSINEDAHCMNCKVGWDRRFLLENFDNKFINGEYKIHSENLLLEKEMSLMPDTQAHIEKQTILKELKNKRVEIKNSIKELKTQSADKSALKQLNALKQLKIDLDNINYDIQQIEKPGIAKKVEIVKKCPNGDCRGFLTNGLQCGLCNIWACKDCKEVKGITEDAEHICDKDILESVKTLTKETKNCPKCSYRIFKIDGCDQMYCSPEFGGCGTAFSWRTGDIETKIHNPHYYDFLRKVNNGEIPRNPDDIVCGAYNVHSVCSDIVSKYYKRRRAASEINVIAIVKKITHMKYVDLPLYVSNKSNLDIRIKYLKNKIDKDGLKKLLQRREKENKKLREKHDVLTMFIDCIIEILSRYCDDEDKNYKQYENEITELRNCVNDCFVDISKIYKCEKVIIKPSFTIKIV
jgi:hypothetical protein